MSDNDRLILTYCPNYYKIINFKFLENDYISNKLVNFYRNYIYRINVKNKEELNVAHKVDTIISKYIDDYIFRRELKDGLVKITVRRSVDDVIKVIIDNVIKIFDRYQEGITRKIYISRWI